MEMKNVKQQAVPDGWREQLAKIAELCTDHDTTDALDALLSAAPQPAEQSLGVAHRDDAGVHLSHCNQGEHQGVCKYGEDKTCPALKPAQDAPGLTVESAPIGTKAPAHDGGHWVRVERGWKWCTGTAVFPRPGGDWTGSLILPGEDAPELHDRAAFESWLARNPDARLWNTTDAMFAAYRAALSRPDDTELLRECLAAMEAMAEQDFSNWLPMTTAEIKLGAAISEVRARLGVV